MVNLNAVKIPMLLDPKLLQKDLELIPHSLWQPFLNNHTAVFWKGVALRSNDGKPTTLAIGDQYFDTPLLKNLTNIKKVVDSFQCNLKRVRFSNLKPTGVIGTHRDIFPGEKITEVRLQIPIITKILLFS